MTLRALKNDTLVGKNARKIHLGQFKTSATQTRASFLLSEINAGCLGFALRSSVCDPRSVSVGLRLVLVSVGVFQTTCFPVF